MSEAAVKRENVGPWPTLAAVREQAPVVQNITNFVAMDLAANVLLAVGASPAMVRDAEEIPDFAVLADAVTINIGTLSGQAVEAMARAAREAVAQGKPWVLDPVGAGTTALRRETAQRLVRLKPTVIRGNGAEILALGDAGSGQCRGLDSDIDSVAALDAARDLAGATGAVVAVTGTVDYVTDGQAVVAVANGDALMTRVTAIGCALSCLIGACCAVNPVPLNAAVHALAIMGVAAESAAADAAGPGSFRVGLLDALYNLDAVTLDKNARID